MRKDKDGRSEKAEVERREQFGELRKNQGRVL